MEKINLKLYEWYFLLGLFLYTVGQFLIFIFFNAGEWRNQEPIDFAHWFLLIGVLLLIPQMGNFPKSKLNLVGTPILVIGIGLMIGMCVLDFVFWSIKSSEFSSEVTTHLINTPAIWKPFMNFNGWFFNLGLLISSLSYFKRVNYGISSLYSTNYRWLFHLCYPSEIVFWRKQLIYTNDFNSVIEIHMVCTLNKFHYDELMVLY